MAEAKIEGPEQVTDLPEPYMELLSSARPRKGQDVEGSDEEQIAQGEGGEDAAQEEHPSAPVDEGGGEDAVASGADERDREISGLRAEIVKLRKRHREAEELRAAELADVRELVERLRQQETEEEVPDPGFDPQGYREYQERKEREQLTGKLDGIEERLVSREERERAISTVQAVARSQENFVKEHPDYYDAYEHVKQARIKLYTLQGMDEDTALQYVAAEEAAFVLGTLNEGRDPAEQLWNIALTFGYQPKDAEAEETVAGKKSEEKPLTVKERAKEVTRTMKEAGTSLSQIAADPPRSGTVLTRAEFYRLVPREERLRIFHQYPDKWETLAGDDARIVMP